MIRLIRKSFRRNLNADAYIDRSDDASSGCAPFKVKFHSNLSPYDSCRWTFGDGGYFDAERS